MSEIAPTPESPPSNRCSATTKGGTQCKAWSVGGSIYCRAHGMTEEERSDLRNAAIRARQARAKARSDAIEASQTGLRALMGQKLEAESVALTQRLRDLALSEDDSTALRGIELWLSRVYGKAIQPTQDVSTELPADVAAIRAMSPEERRAMLQSLPPM